MATPEQIKANRENAKKSPHTGRPVASTTLQTQMMKRKLQEHLDEHLPEMFGAQIKKAKEGDTQAFIAVMDRAYGKPAQTVTGADGEALFPSSDEKDKVNEILLAYLSK